MNKTIAILFAQWVHHIAMMIMYQSNIFPKEHCVELWEKTIALLEELEK